MRVRKAVIPAAGLGTRFLPATKAIPKEMLPLVDKPAIQLIVEEAVASGVEHVIIVTSAAKRAIEDHFDFFFELDYRLRQAGKARQADELRQIANMATFSFVRQKEPLGNGHAVLVAREIVGDEPFAVLWGDDVVVSQRPCLRQLVDVFEAYGGSVCAVMRVPREDVSKYGIVDGVAVAPGVYRLRDLVEKPTVEEAPSDLAAVKGYVLTPTIFDVLERTPPGKGGEIWLADALRALLQREPMFAAEFEGRRYDVGNKLEFLKATVELALDHQELGDEFRAYLHTLDLT
ncbi:MAG TPA: UTP--glucose-1-phosphate uridylyltransferase GalU [Chloroflexota bacterium]